ncbi:hypothetical protein V8D89_001557 [Ganoderma adspersum]
MATSSNGTAVPANPLGLLPKVPHLDNTFGAVLIGTFVGLILYGITLHQSYRYFRMFPADVPNLKFLTVSSALSMHVCYRYLVSNYFNPLALLCGEWCGVVMVATQSPSVPPVGRHYRYFLAVAVSGEIVSPGFYSNLLQVLSRIAATVEAFIIPTFEGYKHATWLVSTGSTMAVSSDIMITAMLISALRRSRTGIKRTDSMLDVMIMYSINTGKSIFPMMIRIANLGSLLFAFIQPGTLIWAGVGIPGVKMYANTLMAALNSRRSIAEKGAGRVEDTSPFGISGLSDSKETSAPQFRPRTTHRIEEWQVKSESTAQTDSVLDIVPSPSKGDFPQGNVPLSDIEKQGQA